MLSMRTILFAVVTTALFISETNGNLKQQFLKKNFHAQQAEAVKRYYSHPQGRQTSTIVKNITFSNPKVPEFYVDGSGIPDVDYDVGPSWAGVLPISGDVNETRQLFFWLFPPGPQGSTDDLILWLNGGPGCSSLEGVLQENGPFSWGIGTRRPVQNPYSWTNLSTIIYVDQPVGAGFSLGIPSAKNEEDVAAQLAGFFKQFLEVFSELKGKKFYLAGESYAGTYLPYFADYIYEHPGVFDLDLQGMWISDPSISWHVVQKQIPALDFVKNYKNVFSFNQSFMAEIEKISAHCNYTGYAEKFLTYPPTTSVFPLPGPSNDPEGYCDLWSLIIDAALIVNPAFDIYFIFQMLPIPWSVVGMSSELPNVQGPIYFNRTDVKKAIHAPLDVDWVACSINSVFNTTDGNDESSPPSLTVLPNVIEKNIRTVIVHGLADYDLIAEGTRIAIQNMTWNGQQGFQTPVEDESFIVDGIGILGRTHTERGLTYFEVALSGHIIRLICGLSDNAISDGLQRYSMIFFITASAPKQRFQVRTERKL